MYLNHFLIYAEGALAESYFDASNRFVFQKQIGFDDCLFENDKIIQSYLSLVKV